MKKQYYTTDNGFEKAESTFRSAGKVIIKLAIFLLCLLGIAKAYVALAQILHPLAVIIIALVAFLIIFFAYCIITSKQATDEQSDIESWDKQSEILKKELQKREKI